MRRVTVVRMTVLALAALAPQMHGCGIFSPRDPRPGGGQAVVCLTANTPGDVVSNLLAQYASFPGHECYSSMLDTSFTFHPDAADSIDAATAGQGTVYAHWTASVESNVDLLLAREATFHMTVFDSMYATTVTSPGPPQSELRFYAYHLVIHAPRVAPDTLFQGHADITFTQRPNTQWAMTGWQDRRDGSGARTWGYLRRQYRVGF